MYINEVDELIDRSIDNIHLIIVKNTKIKKIFDEINFIKFQKDINDFMVEYNKNININHIRKIITNEDNINNILEIIKRYVAYYIFLLIGFFYKGKNETFINNVIEFTKNQSQYNYKINNFFNSENNSNIIKAHTIIKQIIKILDMEQSKLQTLVENNDYDEAFDFLNLLGKEFVDKMFRDKDIYIRGHNIVKSFIILVLYKQTEKKEIYNILEQYEQSKGEYIFINVVIPKSQYIDFGNVESIFSPKDISKGLAHEFYNFLIEENKIQYTGLTHEEKINELITSKIIVPIADDFLLYHRDSEKYDKISYTDKDKKNTRIKYIVNKIDNVSELYSDSIKNNKKLESEVKRYFNNPFGHRKAILVNQTENIKIINRLVKSGRTAVENNEYFNELKQYMIYPYINFKDFNENGFNTNITKTTDIVRFASIDSQNKNKTFNNLLELKVGNNLISTNIVGFMIPSNTKPIQCVRAKELKDIRKYSGNTKENAYKLMLKYIKQTLMKNIKHKASVYWLFDLDKDVAKQTSYEQTSKFTNQDTLRHTVSLFYDEIIVQIHQEITDQINEKIVVTDDQHINGKSMSNIDMAYSIISHIEKKTLNINRQDKMYSNLESLIYYIKGNQNVNKYDDNEDIVYGLFGKITTLPSAPPKLESKFIILHFNLSGYLPYGTNIETATIQDATFIPDEDQALNSIQSAMSEQEEQIIANAICQHFVTWEKLSSIRKHQPNKYSDMMFEFIQQYVIENQDQDYVCKSCGFHLELKKFIADGVFDDDKQKFITFSSPMEIPLEDIFEYSKFDSVINTIDKNIEKIASMTNMQFLLGKPVRVRLTNDKIKNMNSRRNNLTKNIIDVILANNSNLKRSFKERNENATRLYGISRSMSDLYIFDLENTIFTYSSKEKDFYKNSKQNNILVYTLINIILEQTESNILFLKGDKKKKCNFQIFDKYGLGLFGDLKIIVNSAGDIEPIRNYTILCYLLYLFACSVEKGMWKYEMTENVSKVNVFINIMKIIIHTTVDVLNSILEFNNKKDKQNIYEIIATKFFMKLKTIYNNEALFQRIRNISNKASLIDDNRAFIIMKYKPIELAGNFTYCEFETKERSIIVRPKLALPLSTATNLVVFNVNNVTNCPSGRFHIWKLVKSNLTCCICGTVASDENIMSVNDNKSREIATKYKSMVINQVANKYCQDKQLHILIDEKENCDECIKCLDSKNWTVEDVDDKFKPLFKDYELYQIRSSHNIAPTYKFKQNILDKVERNLIKQKNEKNYKHLLNINNVYDENKKINTRIIKLIDDLKVTYDKFKSSDEFISLFLKNIQTIIGNFITVDDEQIYLYDDVYTIDHDHNGYAKDKPIVIVGTGDKKIFFRENHPNFNTNVIYYTNFVNSTKIDIFYDSITKILLGYKEANKDFVKISKQDKKIRITYSVLNRIKYFGYPSKYINLNLNNTDNIFIDDKHKQAEIKNFIHDLDYKRIFMIKKLIYETVKSINQFKNNYTVNEELAVSYFINSYENNKMAYEQKTYTERPNIADNNLILKYAKKIAKLRLKDSDNKHQVFKYWDLVKDNILYSSTFDIEKNTRDMITADQLTKYNHSANILLLYLIEEFNKLIKYNSQNNIVKTNICHFIIELIVNIFNQTNNDVLFSNIDIKKFTYQMQYFNYLNDFDDMSKRTIDEFITGFYGEYKDPDEQTEASVSLPYNKEGDEANALTDEVEEQEALDIDEEINYERAYDSGNTDFVPE